MQFDEFLKRTAALFGLQWRRFQRRSIKRRVERRFSDLGLSGFQEYFARVEADPEEQQRLSQMLTVTISRFFRDRGVFERLVTSVIPSILGKMEEGPLKVWAIGCASGEEPYSLALLWKGSLEAKWPSTHLCLLATDVDEGLLKRAEEGKYKRSSIGEVPGVILQKYFVTEGGTYVLDRAIRDSVEFKKHDILRGEPHLGMDIVFCRNVAFTYFSKDSQVEVLKKIFESLKDGGYMVIGKDESLPLHYPTLFVPAFREEKVYKKFQSSSLATRESRGPHR
jgi:chemotaxis protein methyltransferase CheR